MDKNYFHTKVFLTIFISFLNKEITGQSSYSHSLKQDSTAFKEETFWKGTISIKPHGLYFGSGLARDGSFFVGDSGSLKTIDFKTGKVQTLVKATGEQSAVASVVSPDNQRIAFSWFNGNFTDLIVVSSKTKNGFPNQPRILIKGTQNLYIKPYDWSPDGKWILSAMGDKEGGKIVLVSVKDGSIKLIKNIGNRSCNKISFSPDGRHIVYDFVTVNTGLSDIRLCSIDGLDEKVLVQDVGVAPYWSPDGKYIFFLMSKKYNASDLYALQIAQLKQVGAPILIKERVGFFPLLGFLNNGTFLYGESSQPKLNIYISRLDQASMDSNHAPELISNRFPFWNTDAVWSPDGKNLVYISRQPDGKNIIVLHSADTVKEEDIAMVRGSIVNWFPDNTTLLIKGQSENGPMLLYSLNVKTKDSILIYDLNPDKKKNLFRDRPVLSSDGKLIYYIEVDSTGTFTKIFSLDIATGVNKEITSVDSPDITSFSASPDGKYLSMIVRRSTLIIVSLQSGNVTDLFKEYWNDATKFNGLGWSPDSRYIYYVRTNFHTGIQNLWRILTIGGKPEATGIALTDLRWPKIHPDGNRIVYSGGEGWYKKTYEVKAIKIIPAIKTKSGSKSPQSIIEGKLVGYNGKPVIPSAVGIGYPNAPQFKISDVDSNGAFQLTTDKTGLLILDFSALNHRPQQVALYVNRPKHVKLNVGLSVPSKKEDLSNIILNDVNDSAFRIIGREKMQRLEDGTYSFEFKTNQKQIGYIINDGTKPLFYPLSGTGEEQINRSFPFNFKEGYHPIYYSIATPVNGQVSIKLNPSFYPQGGSPGYVRFTIQNKEDEGFNNLYQEILKRRYEKLAIDLEKADAIEKGQGYQRRQLIVTKTELQKLTNRIKNEKIRINRQMLLFNYLDLTLTAGKQKKEIVVQALNELGPKSTLWWINPGLIIPAINISGNEIKLKEYLLEMVDGIPDKTNEPTLLSNLIMEAKEFDLNLISQALIDKLKLKYPASGSTKHILSLYDNNVIVVGEKVPEFRAHSLDDSSVVYTPDTFNGKIYLIEFWATWCAPCIVQLPFVTKAYDKFHENGFEVLSYSIDSNKDLVSKFRKTKFAMPWLQAIDPALKAIDSEMARLFQIWSLPRALLVDKNGIILAIDGDIEGEKLEILLEKLLTKSSMN